MLKLESALVHGDLGEKVVCSSVRNHRLISFILEDRLTKGITGFLASLSMFLESFNGLK